MWAAEPFPLNELELIADKMQLKILKQDGSFYSALLASLDYAKSSSIVPSSLKDFIESATSDVNALRNVIFDELNGSCKELYQIIETGDYKFSHNLSLAAVNAFSLPMVIVPSACGLPMIPVFPDDCIISHPIFIIFDSRKKAFYAFIEVNTIDTETAETRCFCGQKS